MKQIKEKILRILNIAVSRVILIDVQQQENGAVSMLSYDVQRKIFFFFCRSF
jgi:hypothetical protein